MRKITVNNSVTLDGVMQAPGRADEDTRGGFQHGGWATPYFDSVMAGIAAEGSSTETALLLGRRTYQDFAKVWPGMPADNPFTKVINNCKKYVVSNTLEEPLEWNNSTVLKGEAADSVASLKQQAGTDLVILGSGELIQSLMRHNLIDAYRLLIHPLVLGSGRHLFADGGVLAKLRLIDTKMSTTGVVITTYQQSEKP
jgi:dihydrofolate reductase